MKAVVCPAYGSPELLRIEDVEKPQPKADEVLVRVRATTVAVADHRIRSFSVPRSVWLPARLAIGISKPRQPVLGVELAGVVEAAGAKVTRFQVGDRVYASSLKRFGAHAEYIALPEGGQIARMPAGIGFEEAAAIPVGARTALHYLRAAKVGPGQKVLVYGASGSVGSYAVQLAKHFGAQVTGVCSTANLELVRSLGADAVIDYTAEDFSRREERYDVVFEAVDKSSFAACLRVLAGESVYINVTQPFPSPAMLWARMTSKRRVLLGENPPDTAEALEYLGKLVEAGELRPVIDRRYRLEDIAEAHAYVGTGRKKGNVVVSVS